MRIFILLLFLIFSSFSHAQVYLQFDKNGNPVYSDIPLSSTARKILPKNKEIPTQTIETIEIKPPKPTNENLTPVISGVQKLPYKEFLIQSPKDQETIQNQPIIPVIFTVEPELQLGDKIQLFFDGKPWGQPEATTQFQLVNVDRGIHQLSADLLDKQQKILNQTPNITIYVHHASVTTIRRAGFPAPP